MVEVFPGLSRISCFPGNSLRNFPQFCPFADDFSVVLGAENASDAWGKKLALAIAIAIAKKSQQGPRMSFLKDLGWSVVLSQCRSNFPDAPTMSTVELERTLESNSKDVLILDVRKKEEVQRTQRSKE